jgi:hypothetical protein
MSIASRPANESVQEWMSYPLSGWPVIRLLWRTQCIDRADLRTIVEAAIATRSTEDHFAHWLVAEDRLTQIALDRSTTAESVSGGDLV